MLFGIIPIAIGLLILICTACNHSRQRRADKAAQAAQEAAAAEKKRQAERARQEKQAQAEREKAARQAAAAQKKQEAERKRQEREQRQAAAHALKVSRAAELAQLAERRLQAEKELAQLRQQAEQPADDPAPIQAEGQPEESPADHSADVPAISLDQFAAAHATQAQPFKGYRVAFTGKLTQSGMTRKQAAQKVIDAGGYAYGNEMPAGTNLLVVGDNPGMGKLDKADQWITQVKKITESQFLAMFDAA